MASPTSFQEIILRLQQLPRLEVKSRYESQRARRGGGTAPAALGRSLGVRYLVNGTVQRAGERVVVRVELTRADRAVGIWSERYDQTSANVLDVIDAIARGVATGVAGRLLPSEATDLARRPTADPVAYELFLRGNFSLAQRTAGGLAHAVEAYEAATARDPAFKPALARVAYAYGLGIVYGVASLPFDSVVVRAGRATAVAMRQAGDLSDTWLAQGWLLAIQAFLGLGPDMGPARAALARAIALDPRSAEAHHQFAAILTFLAEDSLAESEYRRALALEPGRAVTMYELAELMLARDRPAEAALLLDSVLATDSRYARAFMLRSLIGVLRGDPAGALADANRALSAAGGNTIQEAHAYHAAALAATGDTAAARTEADSVSLTAGIGVAAFPYVVMGDRARALAVLAGMPSQTMRCAAARSPVLRALRGDPGFERMTAPCPWRR